jgi:hypothetical protein
MMFNIVITGALNVVFTLVVLGFINRFGRSQPSGYNCSTAPSQGRCYRFQINTDVHPNLLLR